MVLFSLSLSLSRFLLSSFFFLEFNLFKGGLSKELGTGLPDALGGGVVASSHALLERGVEDVVCEEASDEGISGTIGVDDLFLGDGGGGELKAGLAGDGDEGGERAAGGDHHALALLPGMVMAVGVGGGNLDGDLVEVLTPAAGLAVGGGLHLVGGHDLGGG